MMPITKQFQHLKIQLEAIKTATNDFADDNCIGKGGFGKVYKGQLILHYKGQTNVAIKRLDRRFGQGNPEFWKEIIMLSLYKHENIVSLLGFCDDSDDKILVYEYASKGSLDLYLNNHELTWIQRLKICIGAARGLAYLHNPGGTQQRLLHRDIKSSNILLEENWNVRISDFGLSKLGPANQQYTFLVSNTVGTIGYCDPLYVETGLLTKESDVYSFGVVLFEILCGRLSIRNNNDRRQPFTGLVRQHYKGNRINEIIFGNIKDEINPASLKTFITIAYRCLKKDREKRPLMTEVVSVLETALQYQVFKPSIQMRQLSYVDHKHLVLDILKHLQEQTTNKILTEEGLANLPAIKSLFTKIDQDGDAYISFIELKSFLQDIRFRKSTWDREQTIEQVMRELDCDVDTKVTIDEFTDRFTKWLDRTTSAVSKEETIEGRLRELDHDGNKKIKIDEFTSGLTKWLDETKSAVSKEETIEGRLRELDHDGDKKITIDEFTSGLTKWLDETKSAVNKTYHSNSSLKDLYQILQPWIQNKRNEHEMQHLVSEIISHVKNSSRGNFQNEDGTPNVSAIKRLFKSLDSISPSELKRLMMDADFGETETSLNVDEATSHMPQDLDINEDQ